MLELGKKARDKITGFEGTITARTEYLHGCNRYYLEPRVKSDGSAIEGQTFDEGSLEVIEDSIKPEQVQTEIKGGPHKYEVTGRF